MNAIEVMRIPCRVGGKPEFIFEYISSISKVDLEEKLTCGAQVSEEL